MLMTSRFPPSDKRWWWIVLPAVLIAAAVAIVLKFKSKKVHDPTGINALLHQVNIILIQMRMRDY